MRGDEGEAVRSQPEAWDHACKEHSRLHSCSSHVPLHVHTGRAEHVHRQRCNETNPQIQSAQSGVHLVASGGREKPEPGGAGGAEAMPCAMSSETKNGGQDWGVLSLGLLGGRKTLSISG